MSAADGPARVDVASVLAGLKGFQRATVAHVVDRLYGGDPVDRFLVADEVGLGKTLVAKGVIAHAVERLRARSSRRIDVVYICSNQDIARQNLARLNPTEVTQLNFHQRLTMLPRVLDRLRRNEVNFIAFTPGTSFDLRSAEGQARERVLLYHLLRRCWGRDVVDPGRPTRRVFQGTAGMDRIVERMRRFDPRDLDDELVASFDAALDAEADEAWAGSGLSLQERFLELRDDLRWLRRRHPPKPVAARRRQFIGDVRELLARTCIEVLDPSLVVLDEFQRFRALLDSDDETAALARSLFEHPGVKVLLLSATPYKMYTLRGELGDDHYADLLRTVRFLAGEAEAVRLADLLRTFRMRLLAESNGVGPLLDVKHDVEQLLRRHMVRTERLAASPDRGEMLVERPVAGLRLEPRDVREYLGLDRVSGILDAGAITDYWKSSAYPLNFMEGYKLDRELERATGDPVRSAELAGVLRDADWLLDREDVQAYRPLDPGNARLWALLHEVVEPGLWQVAWLPPSLPYYAPGPPFEGLDAMRTTKRLVFSAWKVVPKVIATVLSYEAERRMAGLSAESRENTPEARRAFQPLLRVQRDTDGRPTGMPVLGLCYPSPFLARLIDPLALGSGGAWMSIAEVEEEARRRLEAPLAALTRGAPEGGQVDERWFWIAPMLLDLGSGAGGVPGVEDDPWWRDPRLASRWLGAEADEHAATGILEEHLEFARELLAEPEQLGRPPADLADALARLALAGPGTVCLRSLRRVAPELPLADVGLRQQAASVAWGFRSLFNRPEITWLLRGRAEQAGDTRAYWRLALSHALAGNLQAVVDEHAHVLVEWCGVADHPPAARLSAISERMREALSTRAVSYRVADVAVEGEEVALRPPYSMRGQFAVRFGDDRGEQDQSVVRQGHIRTAFNSPYWPFVVATTSVGQEGLDFHVYCHAVTHWNLPSNPVDLEQREGRVHRYKGHAVRKNVALAHRDVVEGSGDPWRALFEAAEEGADGSDLVPYWIYPVEGGARIERTVPALPLSSDERRLEELRRTVAAYRMVFGQPRQEDLVAFLQRRSPDDLARLSEVLRVDLSPR